MRCFGCERSPWPSSTWRFIASRDTVVFAFIHTGNLATAVSIGGLAIFTKLLLYLVHERQAARLTFGIERP
ncbi:MAG: hypothetical protein B7Y45_14160 [Sphingomonas sp. 28-66-16]|nr:MAG: hypothetical protein B7Y45_14160 [Sphingomonas sp. 28-66-16]